MATATSPPSTEAPPSIGLPRRPALIGRPIFAPEDFSQGDVLLLTPLGYRVDRFLQLAAAIVCGAALLAAVVIERWTAQPSPARQALVDGLYFIAYLTGSFYGLKESWESLKERSIDINTLMIVGAFLAAWIHAPAEGAFLLFLFTLSGALEHLAGEWTSSALRAITKILPTEAMVLRDGQPVRTRLREVAVGDRVLVRPGDQVSVDGVVRDGRSLINESSITGEGIPRPKGPGDPVFAGTINHDGTLVIESTRPYHDTALARIRKLVLEAQEQKVSAERFFDRFGRYYTVSVICSSLVFGLVLWIAGNTGADSFYRAITLLIVTSPCALILSVPTAALSALARAAREGILIKGGAKLEDLARVEVLVIDKTGTLTTGDVKLHEVRPLRGFTEEGVLAAACALERSASHPLAQPVLARAEERKIPIPLASEVRNIPGVGLRGVLGGESVFVGRPGAPLVEVLPADEEALRRGAGELRAAGFSVAAVHHGERLGLLAFRDTTRPEAAGMVRELRRAGLRQVLMLTGDSDETARAVSAEVGLDGHHAGLLPEDKVTVVRELVAGGKPVAMVGDGVNDAPALKAATVGIAMGAMGSNAAMEAADVVLLKDDIAKLPLLFALARAARRTMRFNIAFASAVIAVLAIITMVHGVPLSLGVVGHEGSTLLVVAASLRLLFFRGPRGEGG